MRGNVDLNFRAVGPGWPKPFRLTYFAEDEVRYGEDAQIVGWGESVSEAIDEIMGDPRSLMFDDLRGYLLRVLSPLPPAPAEMGMPAPTIELPLEAGTKQHELLNSVPDRHNLFALVQWWPRGDQIKFRAEALSPEPGLIERYESDLEMYHATNIVRIVKPKPPTAKIIEFCVPAAFVTTEVRFFYRTPEGFYFYRANNPSTSLGDYDFDVPMEGVTLLL